MDFKAAIEQGRAMMPSSRGPNIGASSNVSKGPTKGEKRTFEDVVGSE